jgi:glycosyltransferase involved in cell wall biosynthesis
LLRKTENPSPFRLGIWCDYHGTLTPYGGIGVFVHNLVEGLFELNEPLEVVVLIRPGQEQVVSRLQALGGDRLHVVPQALRPTFLQRLLFRTVSWIDAGRRATERLRVIFTTKRLALTQRVQRVLKGALKQTREGNWVVGALLVHGLPVIFLLAWACYALAQLVKALVKSVTFPFRVFDRLSRPLIHQWQDKCKLKPPLQAAQDAHCDVWVIPWVAFADPLPFPSVLFIHDMVTSHYPELFSPHFVSFINLVAPARAAEATLCACMSEFIRNQDLLGVLQLPPDKVRMVRPAPPRDFPAMSWERAQSLKPAQLNRPYLFMPAGIRPAKNQQALIEALRVLRDQFGEDQWDVVFTGEVPGQLGNQLRELVDQHHLASRVHVVGKVDREILAALYMSAWATIMPSLYEQGSFPVYEALHWQCPVACSDLLSLCEQCAAMGDAMLYFDPRNPEDIARTVLKIRDHREAIRARQHAASRVLWQRTWKDVARDWLAVFKEAAELGHRQVGHLPAERPAA